MKKITLLLATVMMSVASFAVESAYKTALFGPNYNSENVSAYDKSWSATNDGFTVDIVNANNNNSKWDYIKIGRKNVASTGTITTKAAIDKAITKVALTIDAITANNITSITLKTKTASGDWTNAGTFTAAKGVQEVALSTPTENLYYQIEVICTSGSSNGLIQISKVEYFIAIEDIPATAITLSETSLEIEQYKQATLTATLEPANATTEIVWTSSDEKIVIVDNGQLNAVGVGSATITASAGEGISATCEVTVKSVPALTCEQAAEIALAVSDNNVVAEGGPYVIRGYVTALAPTKTNNDIAIDLTQYGNYSFWMADSKGEEKVFEAYQVAPVDGQYLATVGDYVEIVGNLTKYSTTPETTGRGTSTVKKLADPTTGVDNATVEQKSVKMIENGQLVIIREGVKYNAQGAVIE